MVDPHPHSAADNATRIGPDRESPPRTPRWVKVFGIIALVLALLFVVSLLTGGNHGPGRHLPPSSVTQHSVHQ